VFDMGKAAFESDNAQACVDGIADASCDFTSESQRSEPRECGQVVTGTFHAGERCTLDLECRSQLCDVPGCAMACCAGTCVGDTPPALAKLGQSCATTDCESSAYCNVATATCTALKPAAATCGGFFECQFGLACVGSGATGTCTALPKLGEACAGICSEYGTTCNPTSRTCVKVALGGDPCASDLDCSFLYQCDATAHCSAGVALGAACTVGDHCADERAFCDAPGGRGVGTCAVPKAAGMHCEANEHCESFSCDAASLLCVAEQVCI
jgi:hypothetical protein